MVLTPLEDIRPEPRVVGQFRPWGNPQQRGNVTQDNVAFAAMNVAGKPKTDILTIKPDTAGDLGDLLKTLKDKGILDQYDEIGISACRSNSTTAAAFFGIASEQRSTELDWNAETRNMPQVNNPSVVTY